MISLHKKQNEKSPDSLREMQKQVSNYSEQEWLAFEMVRWRRGVKLLSN